MTATLTTPETPDVADVRPAPTTRWVWAAVWVASAAVLAGRLPVQRARVERLLAAHPDVTAGLTDEHLRVLAVEIGLVLAVGISLLLLFLLQSLGRVLESHVFTRSCTLGRLRIGLFAAVSTATTLPFSVACLVLGRVSLRGGVLYPASVLLVTAACVLLFRRTWRGLGTRRVVVLWSVALLYGGFATLI